MVRAVRIKRKNILKKSNIPRNKKRVRVKIKKTVATVAGRIAQKHTRNTARLKLVTIDTGCLCITQTAENT